MEFDLTSELESEIVFSMEDQTGLYVLDSENSVLIKKSEILEYDPDRYYVLPVWDSISGFRLMEHFVGSVKNSLVRNKLRGILRSGHGVFRNFKNVLKEYPEIEKLWFSFKEHEMKRVIRSWYSELSEVWGLEKLGEEPSEFSDFVRDDFTFREAVPDDAENIRSCLQTVTDELKTFYEHDLGLALSVLCGEQYKSFTGNEKAFVAETVAGDFVGAIYVSTCTGVSDKVVLIPSVCVLPIYRGLGVSRELLQLCIESLREQGVKYILSTALIVPDFLKNTLIQNGFQKIGSLFYLDLQKKDI